MAERRTREVVVDSSPVIALCAIDLLGALDELFDHILVPLEVWNELNAKAGAVEPDRLRALRGFDLVPDSAAPDESVRALTGGELQVLAIAIERRGAVALIDERKARRVAATSGVPHVGTLATIVESKRRGLIERVKPRIEVLLAHGVHLGPEIIAAALAAAGE